MTRKRKHNMSNELMENKQILQKNQPENTNSNKIEETKDLGVVQQKSARPTTSKFGNKSSDKLAERLESLYSTPNNKGSSINTSQLSDWGDVSWSDAENSEVKTTRQSKENINTEKNSSAVASSGDDQTAREQKTSEMSKPNPGSDTSKSVSDTQPESAKIELDKTQKNLGNDGKPVEREVSEVASSVDQQDTESTSMDDKTDYPTNSQEVSSEESDSDGAWKQTIATESEQEFSFRFPKSLKRKHSKDSKSKSKKKDQNGKGNKLGILETKETSEMSPQKNTFNFSQEETSSEDEDLTGLDASIRSSANNSVSGKIYTCDLSQMGNIRAKNSSDEMNLSDETSDEDSDQEQITSEESSEESDLGPSDCSTLPRSVGNKEDGSNYEEPLGSSTVEMTSVSEREESEGQSSDEPKKKSYRIFNSNTANMKIVAVKCGEDLYIKRSLDIKVLQGGLKVDGFVITKKCDFIPIHATKCHHRATLVTMKNPKDKSDDLKAKLLSYTTDVAHTLMVLNLVSNDDFVVFITREICSVVRNYLERFYPSLYNESNSKSDVIHNNKPNWTLNQGKFWFLKAEEIVNSIQKGGCPRILVCGGPAVSKSTFLQYLVNSALNVCNRVCYIDTDPQQPEFTPPGMISLVEVSQPLIGPGFTHQRKPKLMFYQGGVQSEYIMDTWVASVHKLADEYYSNPDFNKSPLFINTSACSKDQDVKLLLDVIHATKPTEVIQIRCPGRRGPLPTKKKMAMMDSWAGFRADELWKDYKISKTKSKYSSDAYNRSVIRTLSQLAYLANLQKSPQDIVPINEVIPYRFNWSSFCVYICSNGNPIPDKYCMMVLNSSLVALCRRETAGSETREFVLHGEMPVCQCLGYGIVRSVDMSARCLYILTPIDKSLLKQVNLLIKGSNNIPAALLKDQSCGGQIPYLSKTSTGIDPAMFSKAIGLSAGSKVCVNTYGETEAEPTNKRSKKN